MEPVLKASVHDVRYFAALLRGVNFVNRATVTVTQRGFTVIAEEARTLLGTAYIFADIFDEYIYNAEHPTLVRSSQPSEEDSATESSSSQSSNTPENAAFEIPLNTFIECLNIFGTAGASGSSGKYTNTNRKWGKRGEEGDDDGASGDEGNTNGKGKGKDEDASNASGTRGIDHYFGGGGNEKRTGMRMSYAGAGYPLVLLLAEDSSGPTTTCEISTYDPEPHLELPFDVDKMVLKIILKSSWLRDALSELDPSCTQLTFIGNPPLLPDEDGATAGTGKQKQKQKQRQTAKQKPMLRIQAVGTFGSTEMDYPNDRDVLESFECLRTVNFSYRFSHISRALRSLQSSTKTSLRIDDDGLLSLQFLMPSPSPRSKDKDPGGGGVSAAFIEFRCLALDDDA